MDKEAALFMSLLSFSVALVIGLLGGEYMSTKRWKSMLVEKNLAKYVQLSESSPKTKFVLITNSVVRAEKP